MLNTKNMSGLIAGENLSAATVEDLWAVIEAMPARTMRFMVCLQTQATAVGLPPSRYMLLLLTSGSLHMVLATSLTSDTALYKMTKPYNSEWTDWVKIAP